MSDKTIRINIGTPKADTILTLLKERRPKHLDYFNENQVAVYESLKDKPFYFVNDTCRIDISNSKVRIYRIQSLTYRQNCLL